MKNPTFLNFVKVITFIVLCTLNVIDTNAQCTISLPTPTKTLCSGANSNSYTLSGQVTFSNAPSTGSLIISVQGGHSKVFTAPFTSPISYSINKLIADGASRSITASFSAQPTCKATTNFTAPIGVGSGFSNFPIGTIVSNFLWGTNPYPQQSWDGGYLPFYGGPYSYGGGIHDLDLTPPGVTDIAAVCGELAEGVAGGAGSNYYNKYQYIPLENIAQGTAGQNDESQNIPVGGIGKVRSGILRYLFDHYYTSTNANSWTATNGAAFQLAVWEIIHEVYTSNNSFSITAPSANGYYWQASYNLSSINLAQSYLNVINSLNWDDTQWMSYEPVNWHVIGVENNGATIGNNSQDLIFAQPILCNATCSISLTATPTLCTGTNSNTYNLSGNLTFSNAPSTGTLIVSVEGGHSKVFTAPFTSPQSYTIENLIADGKNRTITANFTATSCSNTLVVSAPSAVGTGFKNFPLGSTTGNYYDLSPWKYTTANGMYYPNSTSKSQKDLEAFDVDWSAQNASNYATFCIEKSQSFEYEYNFTIIPLESITRGTAGQSNQHTKNIPVGGIGKVRAGMVRYLMDNYYQHVDLSNSLWTNTNVGALTAAIAEITHESYSSNNGFSLKIPSTNGYYYSPASGNVNDNAAINLGETYVQAINALNWTDDQWMSYQPSTWHVIAFENTTYQDVIAAVPIICGASCSISLTATAGACNPATNQYTVSGQIALTNPPSTGTVTVQIVGGGNQTFTLPQSSPISYSIAGQTADGASHTVNISISGVSCASSTTYNAPSNCTPLACSSTVTATAGACSPANNQYTLTGQVTLTNPPSTGTVTVQIVGGGNQTFTLPQSSPISYSIAGQTSDGASHTVNISISGVSCASSTTYNAPSNCTPSACSSTVTATAGACNPATNQYTVTGQVTLTNPPSTGTVTVQIAGGGNQTFILPQSSPISYSIAGQTADGASHTVNVSIGGVSCASSTVYSAPVSCSSVPCPNPNCVTLKSKKAI